MSSWNIANKSQEERDKINIDLIASGVICRKRLNLPVSIDDFIKKQPEHLRKYFIERIQYYKKIKIESFRY